MNTKEILQRFEETADVYLQSLERFTMEQLTRKPEEAQWSIGQMYMHLINSALYMHLRNAETCCNSNKLSFTGAEKSEAGANVFAAGSFPPVAIHVPPSKEYTPLQPESKEQISSGLRAVISTMRELEPLLAANPGPAACPHPRFGPLNGLEWFQLVEMHYRHHFMQKERLEALIS
ncbi:DinB family protein [Paenibacillus sp. HW567]|uniref:DinB family protein n=1 Tax=Paenibacillus sp. HW567 TaxID=1034769 RepID=UPI000381B046|nr:DinB family protein [Paenibacillus sp. HW567]